MVWPWPSLETEQPEESMWLLWLVRLRWVAILAQVITLSFTFGVLATPLLVVPLLGVTFALTVGNLRALQVLRRETPVAPHNLLTQLLLDVLALSAYFFLAGGPANPFTLLFLVHVAMGAVMLQPRYALTLTAAVLMAYAALHLGHLPLHYERHTLSASVLRKLGQLLAFLISASSITVFVVGLATGLREHRQRLMRAAERTYRTDRLRSIGTLAAGAAHEINTPLSTIGLRVRRIGRRHQDDDTRGDLQVVSDQLVRCAAVVEQLLVGAGDPSASGLERAPLHTFVNDALRLWSKGAPVEVSLADHSEGIEVELPRIAFCQGLINLLENAREAQQEVGVDSPLEVTLACEGEHAVVRVLDRGVGLPTEPDRVGEPFFTTKPQGTGLGVFVARSVADGAGGGLGYASGVGCTEARWWFPAVREPR